MSAYTRWIVVLALWLLAGTAHAGTKSYYYTDAQGTVLAKADAQGNIVASYDYAPYGKQVLGSATSGPTGYTGHVNDAESGLVYMQARYYDPAVGRFLSVDPVGPEVGDIFGSNRYSYVKNNPIMHTDPTGNCPDKKPCFEATPDNYFRDTAVGAMVAHVVGDPIAIFTKNNINPLTERSLNRGQLQDAKLGIVTNTLAALAAPELLGAKSTMDGGAAIVKEGIYEFAAASGKTYVGQSVDISARLAQHLKSGKLLPTGASSVRTTEVLGGKAAREVQEQLRINQLGGIPRLENIRNPIGPARQYLLPNP